MNDHDFELIAAPVVFTTEKPLPNNPLNRPPISYKKPIIALSIYLAVLTAIILVTVLAFGKYTLISSAVWSVLYFAVIAKRATIWCVHLYQNKASDETRLRCVFEPSCSEYMILAIQKYGWLIGVIKGIRRLFRCHPPNGGQDYP